MTKYVLSPSQDNREEYSLLDTTVTAVKPNGARFAFRKGDIGLLEEAMYDPKPESKTSEGSGPNPRAHSRTKWKPVCELTMTLDTQESLRKFVGVDGTCTLLFTRRTPNGPPVTDRVFCWKPLHGGPTLKPGDVATVKSTGNALRIDHDVRGVVA